MSADDDVAANLASLLERVSAAERRAAEQQHSEDQAEKSLRAICESRDKALAEAKGAQAMCRTLQQVTGELEAANETIAKRAADDRNELAKKTDEALGAAQEQAQIRREADAKAVLEDNERLAARIEQMDAQLAASSKHWDAEAHMKDLEQKLLVMRLEEVDGKLREALFFRLSSTEIAEEVKYLRKCEKQWAELEGALARTDEAVRQHDEQVAAVTKEADALEAESGTLTAKLTRSKAKRDKVLEHTLPDLAAKLAAVEAEQEQVKEECRDLQRQL